MRGMRASLLLSGDEITDERGGRRFLRNLREACMNGKPGNVEFWSRVKDEGRALSLISDKEASVRGGTWGC